METFLGGLALAAVSGVTFIAYRHPSAYPQLRNGIFLVLAVAFFSMLGSSISYTVSSLDSLAKLLQAQPEPKSADLLPWIRAMRDAMNRLVWTAAICIPTALYLLILSALPVLIKTDGKE